MTELLNDFLTGSVAWGVLLTLAAFGLGVLINKVTGKAIFNPLLLGSIFVIIFLSVCNIPYGDYKTSAAPVSYLLLPATVALAIPLYEKLDLLKKNAPAIIAGISVGTLVSLGSAFALALAMDLTQEQYATLLPKSVTTATTELEATKATLAATEAELTTTQETLADAQAILAASNESLSFAKLNPATRGTDPGIAPSPMASAVRDPSEAVAFLLVTVGTKTYEPIPLLEDGYYRLIHGVCVNIIHVTETSIEMTDASCADHDCIAQGIVTLENKDTREGGGYIICQQNYVTLRLCTRSELEAEGIVLQ